METTKLNEMGKAYAREIIGLYWKGIIYMTTSGPE